MSRGADYWIDEAQGGHTIFAAGREMLLHIAAEYPGLPDVRTLTFAEIAFFFEGMVPELKRITAKPKK